LDLNTSHARLNNASTLRIGFMHMLSIVRMLYLSSKSLSVHTHRDEGYGGGRTSLTVRGLLPIEIAMSDSHLISKC